MATAAKITVYRVTASCDGVSETSAEVLGGTYGRWYATYEDAEDAAEDLAADILDGVLDPRTIYAVIGECLYVRSLELDDETHQTAYAMVDDIATKWGCEPRQTALGIDGYDPAGDGWMDAGMIERYGIDVARSIGEEIIASIGR